MSALWVSKSASHIKLQCCCHRRDEKNTTDLTGGKNFKKLVSTINIFSLHILITTAISINKERLKKATIS